MIESSESAQQYKLSAHEFKAMSPRAKGGYTFVLQVSKGKPINDIRNSPIARDLLEILQLSKKASELTDESPFQISLDKNFVLHITKIQQTSNQ
jgi:hypothetical protein